MRRNVIVGQSGGPTAAINSSLAGVYRTAKDRGANKVYGMLHGVQGLLQERYLDLSEYITTELDAELLKRTPAAFLGSCRYKLPEIHEDRAVYEKIFGILDKLDIEAFIYIGGNDSMDTIKKLSDYAIVTGHPTRFIGCPKTIMGRNAGWLTGAAALSKGEDCEGPDLIYLPELSFDLQAFSAKVKELLSQKPSVVVAVSEGIRTEDGTYVCELGNSVDFVDAFGHKQLSGTASYLANFIAGEIGCKTRAIELSTLQRSASHAASRVDILEAYQVGGAAVKAADEGDSGKMVVLQRLSDDPYQCGTEVKDVHKIANDEKLVPREWVNAEGTGVTDEFVAYVRPLIQGDVSPVMVDGIPRHLFRPYNL